MLDHLPKRSASVGADAAKSPDEESISERVVTVSWFSLPLMIALGIFAGTLALGKKA